MKSNKPFFLNLFPAFIVIVVLLSILLYRNTTTELKRFHTKNSETTLYNQSILLKKVIEQLGNVTPMSVDSVVDILGNKTDIRYTIIDREGLVIADSRNNPDSMDNHGNRPEVLEAYKGKRGVSTRYSKTEEVDFMYVAIPAQNGDVIIRSSLPLIELNLAISIYQKRLIKTFILTMIAATLISLLLSRFISRPLEQLKKSSQRLAEGDFNSSFKIEGSREIVELSHIMEKTAKELHSRFNSIKRHKERLNAIITEMIEGVIAIDKDEKVFLINDMAKEMLNITNEDVQGVWLRKVLRNIELQQCVDLILKEGNDTIVSKEVSINVGNERKTISINGTILKNAGGAMFVMHDITNLKKLESLRKDFAGNVSHELRTPLTAIKGFVETLIDGALNEPEAANHFLGIINNEVDRLNQLIEDLLTIAQMERFEETDNEVDLIEQPVLPVVENAVRGCATSAQKQKSDVSVHCENKKIETLLNDSLLEQAIKNLVENAIKYSGEGSKVEVSLVENGDHIAINVSDNGPGISLKHQERLFERFYRVDRARSRNMGGTGLGLSIVKHIVTIHNGTVSVESEPGNGSTFQIRLPKSSFSERETK